jgi:hypothetical protein
MAVAKSRSRMEDASARMRGKELDAVVLAGRRAQTRRPTPQRSSPAVALHASKGIVEAGIKELTSAV